MTEITQENNQNCTQICPLAKLPNDFWTKLFHKPFRKRHPFIFWIAIIVLIIAILTLIISTDEISKNDCIALVNIEGAIMDSSQSLEWISKLERNEFVKGVLVRVNSPGGGASASQEIFYALDRLKKIKPVAISMGSMAASGGLMVSMGGSRIFANASTVTGSIGVRMDIPQLQGILEKIGIGQETLTTAPYKDAGSYLRPLSDKDRDYFTSVLQDMHDQFVDIIATSRNMDKEKAKAIADGKIFTGKVALEKGLIDELGDREVAIKWLCEQTGVSRNTKILIHPKKNRIIDDILKSIFTFDINEITAPIFLY